MPEIMFLTYKKVGFLDFCSKWADFQLMILGWRSLQFKLTEPFNTWFVLTGSNYIIYQIQSFN